jgi:hypothetical protein
MAASTSSWLAGLSTSSQRLREQAEALPVQELSRPSFAAEWSIAQVLSHLGSAAEICTALVERGLARDLSGPQREQVEPVWQRWDAMTPLIYGRHRLADPIVVSGAVSLEDLTALFPGY